MTLEDLLNTLIQGGWKPRGENVELYLTSKNTFWEKIVIFIGNAGWFKKWWCTYRELVSKESWLWQFCVKNRLVKEDDGHITRIINLYKDDGSIVDGWWDYHYWLMICSILDESELEEFLIENIKI